MGVRNGSLGELARRLLRGDNSRLVVPIDIIHEANQLALQISDDLPRMLKEPTIELGAEEATIRLWSEKDLLGTLGGPEPNLSVVWVPCEPKEFEQLWRDFLAIVSSLTSAGYPGCIDCAGPAATEPWDEGAQRLQF